MIDIIYVFVPAFQSGGVLWPSVFNRIYAGAILFYFILLQKLIQVSLFLFISGILIYQLTLIGVFSIYNFIPGIVISALLVLTSLVFRNYTTIQFSRTAEFGALDVCESIPKNKIGWGGNFS